MATWKSLSNWWWPARTATGPAMVTCGVQTVSWKHWLILSGKCQGAAEEVPLEVIGWERLSPRGGPHLGSAREAFQHHLHRLARHQLHPWRPKLKHGAGGFGALGGIFALAVTDGRETITLAKRGKTFRCPIEQMRASSFVRYPEAVMAGMQARREAEMESVTGAVTSQWSSSFNTPKAVRLHAQQQSHLWKGWPSSTLQQSQTLVATKVITIQQLVCFTHSKEKLHEEHHLRRRGQSIASLCCSMLREFSRGVSCRPRCIGCPAGLSWLPGDGGTGSLPFHPSLGAAASAGSLWRCHSGAAGYTDSAGHLGTTCLAGSAPALAPTLLPLAPSPRGAANSHRPNASPFAWTGPLGSVPARQTHCQNVGSTEASPKRTWQQDQV